MRAGPALYLQVYSELKEAILSGRFQAGDMIPTEQELMDKFKVSRITTNRALQMLTAEGLVKRRAGIGTFVSEHTSTLKAPGSTSLPSAAIHEPGRFSTTNTSAADIPLVGFVIPFLDGSFGPTIIKHVEQILNQRGMSVAIAATYGDQQKEIESIDRLVRCGVKGLIVLPVNGEFYSEAILRLYVQRFPIVLVDKSLPGIPIPYVTSDNYQTTKSLTDHLVSLGHKNIAFYSPTLHGTSTLTDRYTGFADSLRSHGIANSSDFHLTTVEPGSIINGLDMAQVQAIEHFLLRRTDVTAVLAADDYLAEHVLAAAHRVGRRVPDDLSIACFDGPLVKDVLWHFTHAIQDEPEMARQCMRILDELWSDMRIDGPETVTLPCHLHFGQSTSRVAVHVDD